MDADLLLKILRQPDESVEEFTPQDAHFLTGHEFFFTAEKSRRKFLSTNSYYVIAYIYSGSFAFKSDRGEETVSRGNFMLIAPNTAFDLSPTAENSIVIYILLSQTIFGAAFVSFMQQGSPASVFLLDWRQNVPMEKSWLLFDCGFSQTSDHVVAKMIEESFQSDAYAAVNLKCLLVMLLNQVQRFSSTKAAKKVDEKMDDILNFLRHNVATATLKNTAEKFYMHPSYLSSYIKKHTGRTFSEIHTTLRITCAQDMLATSDFTMEKISQLLGYNDVASFHNMFKRKTGVAPSAYRALHQKTRPD